MGPKIYVWSVSALLVLTAFAKFFSSAGRAGILDRPDPLLLLTNAQLLVLLGFLEVAIAGYLFFGKNPTAKYLVIAWLSANFIVYRLAMELIAPGKPCPCLGTITARLPLKAETVDLLLKCMLAYFFIGSLYLWSGVRGSCPHFS